MIIEGGLERWMELKAQIQARAEALGLTLKALNEHDDFFQLIEGKYAIAQCELTGLVFVLDQREQLAALNEMAAVHGLLVTAEANGFHQVHETASNRIIAQGTFQRVRQVIERREVLRKRTAPKSQNLTKAFQEAGLT